MGITWGSQEWLFQWPQRLVPLWRGDGLLSKLADDFWIVVPFAIIALIFGMASLEQHHDLSHPDFDWVRYCLLAVAFVSLSLGFNSVSTAGWLGKAFLGSVVLAAIMLWFFIRISKTTTKMLLNINVFKSKTFVSSLIAYFFLQFANIGMSFVLPTYVQIVNHQSALIGGLILLPGSLYCFCSKHHYLEKC